MSYVEDNVLEANGNITHSGETPGTDEEMSPALENLIVLTWLRLIHPDLPNLVKERYGTELRSRSLASPKLEISWALESLLEEIRTSADTKILRATTSKLRPLHAKASYHTSQPFTTKRQVKFCPLCKQAGRCDHHY